jgi:coenzyme F420 hydrogenase subunit beta
MKEISFENLKREVLDTCLCIHCGACVAVCPVGCIAFKSDGPELVEECTRCGLCLEACSGLGVPHYELDQKIFGRSKSEEEDSGGFGIRLSDRNLISGDHDLARIGYSGGKVTSLVIYLLEKGEIDGAIVSRWGQASPYPWFSWPGIATTREQIISGAGSKLVFSPVLMALEEAARREDLRSIALVGLPCQVQGFRKLQLLGTAFGELTQKVKYVFGLYCGSPIVRRQDFMDYVSKLCGVSPEAIASIDFRRVSTEFDVLFTVVLKDGVQVEKRLNLMELFPMIGSYPKWHRCRLCTDYSAEFADISFGGSHVTARTPAGEELINRALKEGRLTGFEPIAFLQDMAEQIDRMNIKAKKMKNRARIEELKGKGEAVPKYDMI